MFIGKEIDATDVIKYTPGMPKKINLASMLETGLLWFDWMSVPQLRGRHSDDDNDDDTSTNREENDHNEMIRLQNMLIAINSTLFVKQS